MQTCYNHPVKRSLTPLHRRGIAGADMPQPPRQAAPPGADARQQPQCICARHLPSAGGELQVPIRGNRPSVFVLDISPPQEGMTRLYQWFGYIGGAPLHYYSDTLSSMSSMRFPCSYELSILKLSFGMNFSSKLDDK